MEAVMTQRHWETFEKGMVYAVFLEDGLVEKLLELDPDSRAFNQALREFFETKRPQDLDDETIEKIALMAERVNLYES
jgi:hypothetical protein